MIILLETYAGCSSFHFETTCTGRKLEEPELRERGLITDDILRRHVRSSYVPSWFEVKEGDQIRIIRSDDDHEETDETFVVPKILPDPPSELDDFQMRTGQWVYAYIAEHCPKVR